MSRVLSFVTRWQVLALLVLLAGLPVYGPWLALAEVYLFPVTSKLNILSVEPAASGGINLRMTYTKYRSCEYLGAYAKFAGNDIGFSPLANDTLSTASAGDRVLRNWHVDLESLDGTQIWLVYRCHPLWILAEKAYP